MKKLLLSIFCAFTIFALSAQVSDDFSSYTVGGKLAQQAQAAGNNYWSTWSGAVGGAEDGVIAEQPAGNKALYLTYNNDQILKLGKKSTGTWIHTFKIYIPTGKDGYFNIQANFTGGQDGTWAFECYMGTAKPTSTSPGPLTPGIGNFYAGKSTTTPFNFTHDTWIPMKVIINLDDDEAKFYANDVLVHEWQWTLGNSGAGGCPKVIDAFNMYPPSNATRSTFYIDDINFKEEGGIEVLFETGFDDQTGYVAQKYPQWWQTWANKPGTPEDALISNEQSVSPTNSAKCVYAGTATNPTGTDLVFKTGEPTTGVYTVDFDMYIPNNLPAYFNLLNAFVPANPSACQWAIGVYFNIKTTNGGPKLGTYLRNNNTYKDFTVPSNTWFPVSMWVNLDDNLARISINGTQLLEWAFNIDETGDPAPLKLAAVDFYPPELTSVFYFDNFKFAKAGGPPKFPIMGVTPDKVDENVSPGASVTKTIKVENTGTAIGEFFTWTEIDFEPQTGTNNFTLTYSSDYNPQNAIGYITGTPTVEVAAKYPHSYYCDKVGTYINKIAYYMYQASQDNKLKARVYKGKDYSNTGEVLFETTINNPNIGAWNEVTLPTPILLGGQDIWVAFEFIQPAGGHLMSVDDGTAVENSNWTRNAGGNWSQLKVVQDEPIGNWMIKAFTKGTVVPGCWLSFTGNTYGNVPKGTSKTFDVKFNATGLAEGTYKANIFVKTNDTDHPLFTIPCKITVGNSSVTSITPTSISEVITKTEGVAGDYTITKAITIKNTGNIDGDYTVENVGVDWIIVSGATTGTIAPNATKTFDVKLDATDLEKATYNKDIIITVSDKANDKITLPCTLIVDIKKGVGENKIFTLVFPNPASDNVTIKSNYNINSVEIVNYMGQIVYSSEVNSIETNINTSSFTAGIYFININTEFGTQSTKLVIK